MGCFLLMPPYQKSCQIYNILYVGALLALGMYVRTIVRKAIFAQTSIPILHSDKKILIQNIIAFSSDKNSHPLGDLVIFHGLDIRKASGFVITTEPLGFVLTKEVNVFLLRVQ